MNSKFKKIVRKFKKIWKIFASKRRESASCVQIFVVFGHWRGLWREKQNLAREKTLEKMTILFFLARAPRMSFDHKNLQAPCAPKPLWCQKISYILIFFAILFQIYCSQACRLTVFLATSSWNVQIAQKFAHTLGTWVSSISQNFRVFCNFLGRSKLFDRTVTAQKGISVRWLDRRGVFLSIPEN